MKLKDNFCRGTRCHIVMFGLLLALVLWCTDTIIDVTVFQGGTFAEDLFSPDPHKLFNFVQSLIVIVLLVAYTDFVVRKHADTEESLVGACAASQSDRARFEGILECLGDAVTIQDTTLRIIYQNRMHRDLMGDHAGRYCYEAYHHRTQICPDCLLVKAFLDGGTHTREKSGNSLKGPVTVEITASALKNEQGEVVAGIEAVRDISERKRTEEEILRLNSDLTRQTEELKAVNSDLETFSYSVSHDLRAPLTRICCSIEALRSGPAAVFDDSARFFLENLATASDQMQETIDAMLSLSQVTRSELLISELDLGVLARAVCDALSRTWPHRRIEFSIDEGMLVRADERMLRIVMENLIGNAWKYTAYRVPARIAVGMSMIGGEPVYHVSDNGTGFDMREAEHLFKPFCRLHKAADFPGIGIGLATVQRVIQRHGGRVWTEAVPDAGATFRFTLPGRQVESQPPSS